VLQIPSHHGALLVVFFDHFIHSSRQLVRVVWQVHLQTPLIGFQLAHDVLIHVFLLSGMFKLQSGRSIRNWEFEHIIFILLLCSFFEPN
jgi:hypothetical protein